MRRIVVIAVASALLALPASGAAPAEDRDQLRGTWSLVEAVNDGVPVSELILGITKAAFDGDRFRFWQDTERMRFDDLRGTFTVHPGESPKAIDFRYTRGGIGTDYLAIYEIRGETLRICFGKMDSGVRPKEFAAPAGSGFFLSVDKRAGAPDMGGPD